MGTLFLVATPIGNLEDITLRAIAVLEKVSLIAAEDTRQTHKLLNRYQIHTRLVSYHEHNKLARLDEILKALSESDVALVSDAGTPALNDPGFELVQAAIRADFPVSPIPGPSAPIAALVVSGLPTDAFLYLGYLPRKSSERLANLAKVAEQPFTLIFLETPHRLISSLNDIRQVLGERQIAVSRELTKLHEEIFRGDLSEAIEHFSTTDIRGEITLVVAGYQKESQIWTEERLIIEIKKSLETGSSPSQVSGEISDLSGWSRRAIYRMVSDIRNQDKR